MRYALSLLVILLTLSAATAQPVFTKVADGSSPVPGGSINYYQYGSGQGFAFKATAGSQHSIWVWQNGASTVQLSTGDPIPGIGQPAGQISLLGFSGPTLLLHSYGGGGAYNGTFTLTNGAAQELLGANPIVPGTSEPFAYRYDSVLHNGSAVFFGLGPGSTNYGVYQATSTGLSKILDLTQPLPGGYLPAVASPPSGLTYAADDTAIAFKTQYQFPFNNRTGLYLLASGQTFPVVDPATAVPQGNGDLFTEVIDLSLSRHEGTTSFAGYGPTRGGIYAYRNSTMTRVADNTTIVPGYGQILAPGPYYYYTAASAEQVAFTIRTNSSQPTPVPESIWAANLDGTNLRLIVKEGDVLDGKTVRDLFTFPTSFNGDRLYFLVGFTDNSVAIYSTPIPEPALLFLLTFALLILRRR